MNSTLRLELPRSAIFIAIPVLSKLAGIQVQIDTKDSAQPVDSSKVHPSYHLDGATTSQLIISLAGTATSLLAFATALLTLKKAKLEQATRGSTKQADLVIICNGTSISVDAKDSPQELAQRIQAMLPPPQGPGPFQPEDLNSVPRPASASPSEVSKKHRGQKIKR